MFSFIRGTLAAVGADSVVVENNGIGYLLSVPVSVFGRLPAAGREVIFHTYLAVREDALTLYGFTGAEERELFELLLSVSGIGPKASLNVLSALGPEKFYHAIISEDIRTLTAAPGIGQKSAKRMIMELKEKVEDINILARPQQTGAEPEDALKDAMEAMLALGYSGVEAHSALQAVRAAAEGKRSGDELLRLALAKLGSK